MHSDKLVIKAADYIREKLLGEGSGHDWWHVYRVWQLARYILNGEPEANRTITELGALLHEIADWKFADGDIEAGPRAARAWLQQNDAEESVILQIEDIIRDTSFKGAMVPLGLKTLEAKIVFDADKLDSIGAIGIARTFAYGGTIGRPIYDPDIQPGLHKTFDEYQRLGDTHTVNHFYEKLFLLKDLMQTVLGRELAGYRHRFMQAYLTEFLNEWQADYTGMPHDEAVHRNQAIVRERTGVLA